MIYRYNQTNNMIDIDFPTKSVILVRGPQGIGKTSFANHHRQKAKSSVLLEADMHRIKDGKYVYNPADNAKIVSKVFGEFVDAHTKGVDQIWIAQTFSKASYLTPYIDYVQGHRQYKLFVITLWPEMRYSSGEHGIKKMAKVLAKRNQHNVNADVISTLMFNFEFTSKELVFYVQI